MGTELYVWHNTERNEILTLYENKTSKNDQNDQL